MPNEEEPLGPKKTALVLVIVVGCFAVLWPRIISPLVFGNLKDQIEPNKFDKAAGCCDMIFETDVNAIAIMSELCLNILQNKSAAIDKRTLGAFSSRKLPKDIIQMCRKEVNATCGVDISTFLDQNVRLGKTYKQILEEVRSYNSSTCLRMNFGVPTWVLSGHPHKGRLTEVDSVKQERPAYPRAPTVPAALQERGRALPPASPVQRPDVPLASPMSGRPLPIHAARMRPPLGAGSGPVHQPKSTTTGLLMPLYTLAICVFFVYTLFKVLFKSSRPPTTPSFESEELDPGFRRQVFDCRHGSNVHRCSPDNPLVVNAISGLVAEVRQQMEENYAANHQRAKEPAEDEKPYTNGVLNHRRDSPPVHIVAKEINDEPITKTIDDFKNLYNPSETENTDLDNVINEPFSKIVSEIDNESAMKHVTELNNFPTITLSEPIKAETALLDDDYNIVDITDLESDDDAIDIDRKKRNIALDYAPKVKDDDLLPNKLSSGYKTVDTIIQELVDRKILDKDEAENLKDERSSTERVVAEIDEDNMTAEGLAEALVQNEIEQDRFSSIEDEIQQSPSEIKVIGVESCSVGAPWQPPEPHKHTPEISQAVNSIYLDGEIPFQSRVLVSDSKTSSDTPVILTSKVTLSLIDDQGLPIDGHLHRAHDDDDFTTAEAVTISKDEQCQEDELSEEEVEDEAEEEIEDEVEEEVELEEIEEEEEDTNLKK